MSDLLRTISRDLVLPVEFVETIARSASRRYKRFFIPKSDGSMREICHPSRDVKALQHWIRRQLLPRLPVHPAASAYEKDASITRNAARHRKSRYLMRIDFENFFPSLTDADVAELLVERAAALPEWWTAEDTRDMCRIVCRAGRLTIGAVTSPQLANRLCFHLDDQISYLAKEKGLEYTRYADDLFLSTRSRDVLKGVPVEVAQLLGRLRYPKSLRINTKKTKDLSRKHRWRVTGVVITSDSTLSVGRELKRRIRAMVHQYASLSVEDRSWLRGMLAHIRSIEPEFINRLYLTYDSEVVDCAMR